MLGAVVVAVFFTKNREMLKSVPAFYGIFLSALQSYFFLGVYGLVFSDFTFDTHPETGMYQFLVNEEFFLYCVFALGLFCGALTYSANCVQQLIFSPLIIATSCLF